MVLTVSRMGRLRSSCPLPDDNGNASLPLASASQSPLSGLSITLGERTS